MRISRVTAALPSSSHPTTPPSSADIAERLKASGVRVTEQRLAISRCLYSGGHRHLTAEQLKDELTQQGEKVALATVYNTLHQLTRAGLLKQIIIDPQRTYFDTNTHQHHHFFYEEDGHLEDIPNERIAVRLDHDDPQKAAGPNGTKITSVDVVIRLQRQD